MAESMQAIWDVSGLSPILRSQLVLYSPPKLGKLYSSPSHLVFSPEKFLLLSFTLLVVSGLKSSAGSPTVVRTTKSLSSCNHLFPG